MSSIPDGLDRRTAREWFREQVQEGTGGDLSVKVQLDFLRVWFPGLPLELLAEACIAPAEDNRFFREAFPWNRC